LNKIDLSKVMVGSIIFVYNKDRNECCLGYYMKIIKINPNKDFWTDYGDYSLGLKDNFALFDLSILNRKDCYIVPWYNRWRYWLFLLKEKWNVYKINCTFSNDCWLYKAKRLTIK